jgi:DNA-binding CsgD family transcriptional regulator
LSRAVQAALSVAAGKDDRLVPPLRLTRSSGRAPMIVLLAPLPPPAFELWHIMGAARVLVLIIDPKAPPRGAGALRAIFGLTAAEARVAALVGSGLSSPQAAAKLGLSLATVKTHLTRCYDKTGVRSQTELVRLLSLLPAEALAKP